MGNFLLKEKKSQQDSLQQLAHSNNLFHTSKCSCNSNDAIKKEVFFAFCLLSRLTQSLCFLIYSCRDLSNCDLGRHLNLPYQAPDNRNDNVEFRYSIVFSYHDFLEDMKVVFTPCPVVSAYCEYYA